MSLRIEFVHLARRGEVSFSELCRRFQISRKTGYKWLNRSQSPQADLTDRSRRPQHSPHQTPDEIVQQVIDLRRQHPMWGGRKLSRRLKDLGVDRAPAPSTITHILHRHGLITPNSPTHPGRWQRFEHEQPNDLWQMDFKGYFHTRQGRCDPLTVIDDHSRYNLALLALQGMTTSLVKTALTETFQRYGLPRRMNMDNGQPWGAPRSREHGLSKLTAWLIRLGVQVSFSRPAHPQTNGKDERFHRTLKAEVIHGRDFKDLNHVQCRFDQWRDIYNHQRPHEALAMAVPSTRYRVSRRPFPRQLPRILYPPQALIRRVQSHGYISFKRRWISVSKGLHGCPVALLPDPTRDGLFELFYCQHRIKSIDLNQLPKAT